MSNTFDVHQFRNHFPSLLSGIAHFDGPGGSQVPEIVGKAIAETLCSSISNRGVITLPEKKADAVVHEFRNAVADFLDADPRGIIYGRSWTALIYDFARAISKTWNQGDEIVVTRLDHDGNIRPWIQAAERVGAVVKWVEFDPVTGTLLPEHLEKVLSAKTKLVAMTGASNIIGTMPDIEKMIQLTHQREAIFVLDAVHLAPHASISFKNLDADIIGCSAYKFMGPHCGILAVKPSLLEKIENDKLLPATNQIPERFELGTLPYETLAGVTSAINFIADIDIQKSADRKTRLKNSMKLIEAYETELFEYLISKMKQIRNIQFHGNPEKRTPTLYFRIQGKEPATIHQLLASKNISAPGGNFYALEASRWLGLGDVGAVRVGLAPYSTKNDVDRLVDALGEIG
ncbi:MAG: cysteine desulfurase-like protein [Chitinophagaceae bacterium]